MFDWCIKLAHNDLSRPLEIWRRYLANNYNVIIILLIARFPDY